MRTIGRLRNPIRHYDWGSRTALAELQGRASPSPEPEAELWIGAHPDSPSEVEQGGTWRSLIEVIAEDPEAILGAEAVARHGTELPFLLKVLAADAPLSIQAHPDERQAREGFDREEALGIPRDAPARNFRDPHAKPELICALSRFRALRGFRPLDEALAQLVDYGLEDLVEALPEAPTDPRALIAGLLALATDAPERVSASVARAAERAAQRRGLVAHWVGELSRRYPGDVGALAPLLLHVVELAPGEAMYLPAGELHSYLCGLGVEIMGNSDNVLRGGLTPKHVDPPELLRVLRPEARVPEILHGETIAVGVRRYATPSPVFELSVLEPRPGAPCAGGGGSVELLLVTRGSAEIDGVPLCRGEAALAPAAAGPYRVVGDATLYRAGLP